MNLGEPSNNNTIEVDGVQFETLVPERELKIPNIESKTKVQFGIRITNNSLTSYRFMFFCLSPEVKRENGQFIQRSYAINATKVPTVSDFLLVQPQESLTFFINAKLCWRDFQLRLTGDDGTGGVWSLYNLKPGVYSVRFTYENRSETGKIDGGMTPWQFLESMWTGAVSTPDEEFRIVWL
ncbi:MAG: hypothetical protein MUE44_16270 [Oscillatoriaceae cyanobacterium Prado104]|jgi:hypothetical protein|nr:hypothetical protein [Oscillatoriaceae cyanobacterium Prado104]